MAARTRGDADPLEQVTPQLPFTVADYVDFYSSLEHATNLGRMFRPDCGAAAAELAPSAGRLPRARRDGRRRGTPIRRPRGPGEATGRRHTDIRPSRRLDIELEVGFVVGVASALANRCPPLRSPTTSSASCSSTTGARATSRREYAPLGPFLGKSFATSVSAWVTPPRCSRTVASRRRRRIRSRCRTSASTATGRTTCRSRRS